MLKAPRLRRFNSAALTAIFLFGSSVAVAQSDDSDASDPGSDADIPVLVVTGQKKSAILPTETDAFGLGASQLETPRSTSSVSKAMIDQYSLTTVRDLIAVVPGTFTASFYGVDGTVNIRGEYADNFFRGFKRVENQGTYVSPIDSSLTLDVVRGIASPAYGTGRAGGYVDFAPRSDRSIRFKNGLATQGEASVAAGTNDYYRDTLEWGTPFSLGGHAAGVDLYVEKNQSAQYFDGIDPKHTLAQLGLSFDLPAGWELDTGWQYLDGSGMQGTTGINRLTQDLVDHRNYISGRPTAQIVADGASYITPDDIDAMGGVTKYYATSDDYSSLDADTIQTVKLGRHTVLTSPYDFGDVTTNTAYLDLIHAYGPGQLKVQGFFDDMSADSYNGYGFAKRLRDTASEFRLSYNGQLRPTSWLGASFVGGAGYRRYDADESYVFARGYMVLDRQDISVGATPDSIFNPRYVSGAPWDQVYRSTVDGYGAFFNTAVDLFDGLKFTGGARRDEYRAQSINDGLTDYSVSTGQTYTHDKGATSWSASLSYVTPWGLVPYVTRGRSYALETLQGGAVTPGNVANDTFLSPTTLTEGGLKGSFFDSQLFFAISAYKQRRIQSELLSSNFTGATTNGVESELRWAINQKFGISAVATRQRTKIAGSSYLVVTPEELGLTNTDGWGYIYEASTSSFTGLENGYVDRTQPEYVYGLFANYEVGNGLGATLGGNYVDHTSGQLPGAVVFPHYYLMRGSVHYDKGAFRIALNVNNILDERYYIPQRSTETEGAAMPGEGRTAVLKVIAHF
ncbi:MAG: TonB-dependent receptor [Solimonas sp.]